MMVHQKGEIFRGVSEIQEILKFKDVRIMNNLNKDELLIHKEVQTLYTEACSLPNVQAKMKGPRIVIDGTTYDRTKFVSLPHGITSSTASTII